jgi:ABC-2 type transport system permease protein
MNARMIAALVWKDLRLFFTNRFFALITVLALVVYIVIFFALPNSVDETLELGWYGPDLLPMTTDEMEAEGLVLVKYASEAELRQAVEAGDELVGVAVPDDFVRQLAQGSKPQVRLYFQSTLPEEFRDAYSLLMSELAFMFAGQDLELEAEEVMLGPDMAGQQIPPRQRMLPLLAVFIVVMEIYGLATLLSAERENGTLRALLVTPLRLSGLFTSKGITGVLLTFVQAALFLAITGGLRREPLIVLTIILLAAVLITGISFLIASVARDFMSVVGWGMLVIILMAIPAFNVLLPGLTSDWVRVLPSYYYVDPLYRVINFGAGWSQVYPSLLALLAFGAAFFALGVLALWRKLV